VGVLHAAGPIVRPRYGEVGSLIERAFDAWRWKSLQRGPAARQEWPTLL